LRRPVLAANLNIHLHGLVLDGVYRCGADGALEFVEVDAPTDDELHALPATHRTTATDRIDCSTRCRKAAHSHEIELGRWTFEGSAQTSQLINPMAVYLGRPRRGMIRVLFRHPSTP
jgi:hypothetical protein